MKGGKEKSSKFKAGEDKFIYPMSTSVSGKIISNEKGGNMPPRNAMGEYLGGKPLTSLGDPSPGPADYTPSIDLTKSSEPQYSIVGKYKPKQTGLGIPGPADYTTTGDLIWKKKKSTLKGRGKSYFDEEAAKSVTVIGPAKYNVENQRLGKNGPKHLIAHKQTSTVYTGPPNSHIQPVDSHGFQTPGPNYRPNSGYWKRGPEKSFGNARKDTYPDGPGPGDYTLTDPPKGPTYSFGGKLPPPPNVQRSVNKESPAPNIYNLGTTMGNATSVTLLGRRKEVEPDYTAGVWQQDDKMITLPRHQSSLSIARGPSPATYYLRDSMKYQKKPMTLAYRWFDTEEPKRPGPADYSLSHKNLKNYPSYSHRQRTKPSYPDSLNYVTKSEGEIPGPGSYNLSKDFVKNDNPSFSIKRKITTKGSEVPAPNAYLAEQHGVPGSRKAPSFSMGKRFEMPSSKVSPGPAAYAPALADSSPKYTMTSRPVKSQKVGNPAANAYGVPSGVSVSRGVAFKSRASPYVYSGFRTTKLTEMTV